MPLSEAVVRARFDSLLPKYGMLWRALASKQSTFAPPPAPAPSPAAPLNPAFLSGVAAGGSAEQPFTLSPSSLPSPTSHHPPTSHPSPTGSILSHESFQDDNSNDSVLELSEEEPEGELLGLEGAELTKEQREKEERMCAEDSFIDDGSEPSVAVSYDASDSSFSLSSPSPKRPGASRAGSGANPLVIDLNDSASSFGSFASTNSPPLQMLAGGRGVHTNANLLAEPEPAPAPRAPPKKKAAPKPTIVLCGEASAGDGGSHYIKESDAEQKLTAKNRATYLSAYFSRYNRTVFDSALSDVKCSFSNKLLTTAGITRMRRAGHEKSCVIELSTKVIDDVPRLASTLLHEMCHAAQFLVDNATKPPHGPAFQRWVKEVERFYPHLMITTCHNYEIKYKYAWACQQSFCGSVIGRHSRSVVPGKHVCGKCKGQLVEIDAQRYYAGEQDGAAGDQVQREKTPVKKRAGSLYNEYVKENEKKVRADIVKKRGKVEKGEVMRELGKRWKEGGKEAFAKKKERAAAKAAGGKENASGDEDGAESQVVDVDAEWGELFGGGGVAGSDDGPKEGGADDEWMSLADRLAAQKLT